MNFKVLIDNPLVNGRIYFPDKQDTSATPRDLYAPIALIPHQTHSTNVSIVSGKDAVLDDVDALISFTPNLTIGVLTADCVPILIYATDIAAVAAVHAGWRGALAGIVDNVLNIFLSHNADPANIHVLFGPSISMAHYEVDETLADKFRQAGFINCISYPEGKNNRPHIDLQQVNIQRLLNHKIPLQNISPSNYCTFASRDNLGNPIFQSHRRSAGNPGRNLTCITLKDFH